METLKLNICHYINCESHIHLGVLRKTNGKSEQNFGLRECETSAARWASLLEVI